MGPKQYSKFDQAWVNYGQWLIKWRWLAIALSLIVAGIAGFGAQNLWFDNNYRAFFSKENPQLQAFEELQDTYTKNDNILIVLAPASGRVFTPEVLSSVKNLTDEAWRLPYAIRVDSVTNFQHTRAEEDDLLVTDLAEDPGAMTPTDIEYARSVAVSEPALLRRLINEQASVTALNITFQLPDPVTNEVSEIVAVVRQLVDEFETSNPDIAVKLTGTVMMNNAFFEASISDIKTLVPFMYVAIIITMLLLLRCLSSTVGTVLVIGLSVATAMGIAGWLGMKLTSPSASAPTVIMTLAVADCIHILVTMFAQMRTGLAKRAAIVESLRINMQPVFLTSVTTAIGFLTLNFSDAPPFRDLGNITAMGVMAAFFFAIFFLPAFVSVMPCRSVARRDDRRGTRMDRFADFVVMRHKALLSASILVSLVVLAFIPRNELNDEFVQYFKPSIEFRQHTDFTTDNLTGLYQVQYSLKSGEANGVSDPAFLQKLEAFSNWYRAQPHVMHVSTMADTFKRLNRNLHGDDPDWYRLPDNRELGAQYLLLFEMSLPFGLDLNNQLNIDKSSTQFVAATESISTVELRDLVSRSEQWLTDNAPEMFSYGIGVSVMFSYISERNIKSMLGGTVLGLVLISGILLLALRSVKLGVLSLLPNLLPIGLTFGIWGMTVAQINVAASIVSGMILGIVVDDTVHFLSKYLRARREQGLDAQAAVRYAFHTVGIALLVTTLILVAGFMVLAQSNFVINGVMSILTAMGIAIALIVDFLFLPPLLIALDADPARPVSQITEVEDAPVPVNP